MGESEKIVVDSYSKRRLGLDMEQPIKEIEVVVTDIIIPIERIFALAFKTIVALIGVSICLSALAGIIYGIGCFATQSC